MVFKVMAAIGVVALILALGSHPEVLGDIGKTAHDALALLK